MARQLNHQQIAWFWDLHKRQLIELDPPYQRKSVWNQEYKDFFIDTVLRGYPSPAIFIYQETIPEGSLRFSVVDGKQRLTSLFEFADNQYPVSEVHGNPSLGGKYFKDLDTDTKSAFWGYQIAVETLHSSNESYISDIFDRINRNVAKLTRQELRHAKYDGTFIRSAERLTDLMYEKLGPSFPNIAKASRKQMKDVELVSQLLLLVEEGPKSYSQDAMDQAYSDRDQEWTEEASVTKLLERTLDAIQRMIDEERLGFSLRATRLANQADFYSFVGAVVKTLDELETNGVDTAARAAHEFFSKVATEEQRNRDAKLASYYEAARSASNDIGARRTRIDIMTQVLTTH
jgi:hypothetical protein